MALLKAVRAVDMEEPYKALRKIKAKKATTKQQKLVVPAMSLNKGDRTAGITEEPRKAAVNKFLNPAIALKMALKTVAAKEPKTAVRKRTANKALLTVVEEQAKKAVSKMRSTFTTITKASKVVVLQQPL